MLFFKPFSTTNMCFVELPNLDSPELAGQELRFKPHAVFQAFLDNQHVNMNEQLPEYMETHSVFLRVIQTNKSRLSCASNHSLFCNITLSTVVVVNFLISNIIFVCKMIWLRVFENIGNKYSLVFHRQKRKVVPDEIKDL